MMEKQKGSVFVELAEGDEPTAKGTQSRRDETLYGILHRVISMIFFPDPAITGSTDTTVLQRIKTSFVENAPHLREASSNTVRNVLLWTRRGSPLRAPLVISVGTMVLLALTGLLVFMLFFVAATFNAIVISLLMSLAAAGGFLALFFACVIAIYVGALSVALFIISAITISLIVAVLTVTGWIGFFWIIWLATKKSVYLAKHSISATGSALSAYSTNRHARYHQVVEKVSD